MRGKKLTRATLFTWFKNAERPLRFRTSHPEGGITPSVLIVPRAFHSPPLPRNLQISVRYPPSFRHSPKVKITAAFSRMISEFPGLKKRLPPIPQAVPAVFSGLSDVEKLLMICPEICRGIYVGRRMPRSFTVHSRQEIISPIYSTEQHESGTLPEKGQTMKFSMQDGNLYGQSRDGYGILRSSPT